MKVKDLFGHMQCYSDIKEIDVKHKLKTIDTLRWPDCAPYRNGCKYEKATLNSFTVIGDGILQIHIEGNF